MWGVSTVDRLIPLSKSVTQKMFPFDDVIMELYNVFAPDKCNKNRYLFSKLDGTNHFLKLSIDWEISAYLDLGERFGTPEYRESSIS